MKNLPFFIFIGFLQSCSINSFDQHIEYRVDPLLKPYVDQFYEEAEKRGVELQRVNLIVALNTDVINPNYLGVSQLIGDQRMILINQKYYDRFMNESDSLSVERLMFHEMGHAILNRKHILAFSIMNSGSYYKEYRIDSLRDVLIDEMFKINN